MNQRVLFVDDAPEVVEGIRTLLGTEVDLFTAGDAREALARCACDGPFAVILSDQEMPGMSGTELLAKVHDAWPDTSRILMTGYAELDMAVRALHEGRIFRLLRKPFDREALRTAIRAGIEQFEHVQQERLFTEQLAFSRESLLTLTQSLEQRLAQEIENLQSLQDLGQHLSSSASLEEVAATAAQAVSAALGGRATRVELSNPHRGEMARGVVGAAAAAANDDAKDHVVPVCTPEGEIGSVVVALGRAAGSALTRRDERVLASLVSSTALAAHGQIRRAERDQAQLATVFAMARLAERRDSETGAHLERVSEFSRLVAEGLREDGKHLETITDSFVDDIVRAAPLHDIGKVGIPDRILLKPGRLDRDEWDVMKQHTTIGAETLRSILESGTQPGFLSMGHDIALAHHEKWDGSGYPAGLAGEAIPLPARIVALADVYDALTSERPYKKAWSHGRALELISSEGGKHFDPDVVAAFTRRADRADEIRVCLRDEVPEAVDPEPVDSGSEAA